MPELLDAVTEAQDVLSDQELEQHVQSVASSPHFMRAETLRKLLLYLWQQRAANVSEYAVGTEALGRRVDFDPKTDASVRVQISRLRRKLKDFYDVEGAAEPWQLQIPVGTHTLVVVPVTRAVALVRQPAVLELELPLSPALPARRSIALPAVVVLAVCAIAVMLGTWVLWQRHTRAAATAPSATRFWSSVVAPGVPVKIVLPTPMFFTFPGNDALHVRDTRVNSYESWPESKVLRDLKPSYGEPALDRSYTVTTDTLAAITLGRYLDRVGLGGNVSFEVTGDRSMNLLEQSTVVAFGAHATLYPFRDYLQTMNFSVSVGEASVENANPQPGEQRRYLLARPGIGVTVEPALVAVLPGRSAGRKLVILQARHTASLIEMLTSRTGDALVQRALRDHGSPEFFEMAVLSEVEGDHAVRSWPVALHAFTRGVPGGQM